MVDDSHNATPSHPDELGSLTYLVKQVELGLRRPLTEIAAAHGLSIAQYTALTVLRERPGLTSSELARRSFVSAQSMAKTIGALLDGGYAYREADPNHRRQLLLFISDGGTEKISNMSEDVSVVQKRMVERMTPGEAKELMRLLRMSRDSLRPWILKGEQ